MVGQRRAPKARVIVGPEGLEKSVARGYGADAGEPELLHQAILQRVVGTFDSSFGWRGVRTDALDVQVMQCAAELRNAFAARDSGFVDPKDGVLVTVEGDRLTILCLLYTSRCV